MSRSSSFTEITNSLTRNVNVALESLVKMNESMTTESDSVSVTVQRENPVTGEVEPYTFQIPSFTYSMQELNRISNAVDVFLEGKGTILLNDGTYREVKTIPIAQAPENITGLSKPTKFNIKDEWYSDDFLYPKMYVEFDLKDKINDRSDRVMIKRVIFDNFNEVETQWFRDNFVDASTMSYYEAIQKLKDNGKRYWEDDQTKFLPLTTNEYTGQFLIKKKQTINGQNWYYLNTLNYKRVSDEPVPANLELKVGDRLRYGNNAIFRVIEIVSTENRVRLVAQVGLATPTEGTNFDIYSEPFVEKNVRVNVSEDECNILFFKGVNENFNLVSDNWGDSISFYTNDLQLQGNTRITFGDYYHNKAFDLAQQFEGLAKEKSVPAYFGIRPDTPSLDPQQFRVTQVNKQINASLDTENIKNTQSQIENTKTIINSLKDTISQQKAELVELTDAAKRQDLQNKINNNTTELSKKTTEYQSLVRSLATIAEENNVTEVNPKYRVRGFFDIPKGKKRTDNPNEDAQKVVQFEISYRYLRLDDTGNPLETYTFTDPSTGQEITGTFTDWNIVKSPVREKVYDNSTGTFVWKDEAVSDGEIVNINQVDIPIQKGEKVQLRVRSLSEAGWPTNPQKSEWSDKITIDFPADLTESNQVTNVLQDAQEEQTSIRLEETLAAEGVTAHLRDGMPNPNEGDEGTYFKHQSKFVAYNYAKKSIDGETDLERTVSLQSFLENLPEKAYIKVVDPSGGTSKTVLFSELFQSIVNELGSTFYNNL